MSAEQTSSGAAKRENVDDEPNTDSAKRAKLDPTKKYVVDEELLRMFIVKCAQSAHTNQRDKAAPRFEIADDRNSGAHQLAQLLMDADKRGHYSHGVNRLDNYLKELFSSVNPGTPGTERYPKVEKQKGGTALVDGGNCLGAVVGNYCAELAVKIAKENGIAWICAYNSNHFGICAHYALKIAKEGFIGMSFTNASPIMFLTGAAEKSLGSNPMCVIANGVSDNFELDMATSNVAYGKVELAKYQGKEKIPKHWSVDRFGCATTDPVVATDHGGLVPLGGMSGYEKPEPSTSSKNGDAEKEDNKSKASPKDASYKGSGLAMMIEIIAAVLSGAVVGKSVRRWRDFGVDANLVGLELGQCFVALDPECFAPNFKERLQAFIDEVHGLERTDKDVPVLVPGDPECEHLKLTKESGGIIYVQSAIDNMIAVGKKYGVEMFKYE